MLEEIAITLYFTIRSECQHSRASSYEYGAIRATGNKMGYTDVIDLIELYTYGNHMP